LRGEERKYESKLGTSENFKPAIAASNAAQLINPRGFDFENSVEKTWTMSCLKRLVVPPQFRIEQESLLLEIYRIWMNMLDGSFSSVFVVEVILLEWEFQ
jgi:hypothetical protein